MARKQIKKSQKSATHAATPTDVIKSGVLNTNAAQQVAGSRIRVFFTRFAQATAKITGHPVTFLSAVAIIVIWAVCGPIFKFSDTWQLVINTSTTIVTFLMVFLIQNTQNRDSLAIQLKLSELVLASQGARDLIASIEDMTDEELEKLHDECRTRADHTLQALQTRKPAAKSANADKTA